MTRRRASSRRIMTSGVHGWAPFGSVVALRSSRTFRCRYVCVLVFGSWLRTWESMPSNEKKKKKKKNAASIYSKSKFELVLASC